MEARCRRGDAAFNFIKRRFAASAQRDLAHRDGPNESTHGIGSPTVFTARPHQFDQLDDRACGGTYLTGALGDCVRGALAVEDVPPPPSATGCCGCAAGGRIELPPLPSLGRPTVFGAGAGAAGGAVALPGLCVGGVGLDFRFPPAGGASGAVGAVAAAAEPGAGAAAAAAAAAADLDFFFFFPGAAGAGATAPELAATAAAPVAVFPALGAPVPLLRRTPKLLGSLLRFAWVAKPTPTSSAGPPCM